MILRKKDNADLNYTRNDLFPQSRKFPIPRDFRMR